MTIKLNNSCLEVSVTSVIWTYVTFENKLETNYGSDKYFSERSEFVSYAYFSIKYFL